MPRLSAELASSLQAALVDTPTPFVVVDSAMTILFTSRGLTDLFRYEPGALRGKSIHTLLPQNLRERHASHFAEFVGEPGVRQMGAGRDLVGLAADGSVLPVEVGLTPIQASDQLMVLAQVTDVRPRQQREAQFRLALNAAAAAILLVSEDGTITLANHRCRPMFGYDPVDLEGQSVDMLLPDQARSGHARLREGFHREPSQRAMGANRTLRARRADGSEFPVAIGLTPVGDNGRQVLCTVSDITEAKAASDALRDANDQLSQKNGELAAFVYSASHDLKAPLTSVSGLLRIVDIELARGNYELVAKNIARMNMLVGELSNTVRGLLNVTRADHLDEEFGPVDLHQIVDVVLRRQETLIRSSGVDVQVSLGHTGSVVGSADRYRQVIDNLVSNGCKYSEPERDSWVRIETVNSDDKQLQIIVADNGVGIPANNHEHVFQMFRRFHSTKVRGSGLGLSLVRKHLFTMGGTISFESTPAGTTFTINVPSGTEQES